MRKLSTILLFVPLIGFSQARLISSFEAGLSNNLMPSINATMAMESGKALLQAQYIGYVSNDGWLSVVGLTAGISLGNVHFTGGYYWHLYESHGYSKNKLLPGGSMKVYGREGIGSLGAGWDGRQAYVNTGVNGVAELRETNFQIGVGYMDGPIVNIEIPINSEGDEVRLIIYGDYYYPINKLAILYQPNIRSFVGQLHPTFAFGPSVGYWRTKARTFYYPTDVALSQYSTWKKNPVISLDGLAGLEYGTGSFAVEVFCYYSLGLSNNDWGAPRPGMALKYRF